MGMKAEAGDEGYVSSNVSPRTGSINLENGFSAEKCNTEVEHEPSRQTRSLEKKVYALIQL
jgi:hypothetical protein